MIKDSGISNKKVLVVGSFVMDLIVLTKVFPKRGETVLGTSFMTAPGGKGANQAAQMGLLGLPVDMVGKLGDDKFGDELLQSVKNAGVNVDNVGRDGSFSAVGNVQIERKEDGTSENRIIVVSGANMEIEEQDVKEQLANLKDYDLVVQQNEIPQEINKIFRNHAKMAEVKVLLNPAPAVKLDVEDFKKIDYLVPNEHELAYILGESVDENIDLEKIKTRAQSLVHKGIPNVIVTLGDKGSCWVTEAEFVYKESFKNVKSIDPTAAGDSFIGALVHGILSGKDKEETLEFANAVGALTVSKEGAQTSLSTTKEVLDFLNKSK